MVPVQGSLRPWRRCGGLRRAALDFARRCDPPVYLSNLEKESLFLTGFNDVPPWVVQQGLEQALGRGSYVPGEEALRMRLADALDLEERLAAQVEDEAFANGFQQGLVEGIEASQEAAAIEGAGAFTAEQIADYLAFPAGYEGHPDDHERMQLLRQLHNAKPTTEGQEAPEEPPTAPWRSPLEIVTDGAEEPEQGPSGGEDAAPAAVAQQIEDRDFSSCTKAQLLTFAADHFGVQLKLADSKDELIAQVQRLVDEANEKAV